MISKIPFSVISKTLIKNPSYLPFALKALYSKHFRAIKDIKRADGKASQLPLQISLRITNKCNQRCAICGQYGKEGYINKGKASELLTDIDVNIYKKIVDETAINKPVFYITGGEAFMYKGLLELTQYIKDKGCFVYVISNGSLVEKYAQDIVAQKWDMLTVSLDGPEEIHDKCRGLKGSFAQSIKGIEKIKELRVSKSNPILALCATISSSNQNNLEELFDTVAKINPDLFVLYLSWFTSEEIGLKQEQILKSELGINAFSWKSYIGQNTNIDVEKIKTTLKKQLQKKYSFPWFYIPFISEDKIDLYFNNPKNYLGYGPCVSPYIMVDIMPNGDVTTCRDYIDVVAGNIKDNSLASIWNGERFVSFRKLLIKNNGVLPQCSRCCGLMGF